jgi:glycosyltransferase involved in cell wall biosynthesis
MGLLPDLRSERRFANRERNEQYDFVLRRPTGGAGISALVRVRNEASKIAHVLRSILPLFDQIVVVDNASEDDTRDQVERVRQTHDPEEKIGIWFYPHQLARFGPEHSATPGDSLHSAVYFTNWSLAHCDRRLICKWDGDMIPVRENRAAFADFLDSIRSRRLGCWTLAGQTVYRTRAGEWYLSQGEVNREVEIFPNGWGYHFVKEQHWERLRRPKLPRKRHFEPVAFYELKSVAEDEFAHWSTRDWPSPRKRREWENFRAIAEGRLESGRFSPLPPTFLDDQVA